MSAPTGSAMGGYYSAQAGSTTASNGDSTISQTFTTAGDGTVVVFWYKQTCGDPVSEGWATATLRDNATGVTTTVLPPTCTTGGYTQVKAPITASRSYTLNLTNHDDGIAGEATFTHFDTIMTY